MKPCPYCAEEIKNAATVCKHCGRDGITPVVVKRRHWGWSVLIVFGMLCAIGFGLYLVGRRGVPIWQFEQRRAAWHQRCDQHDVAKPLTPEAKACADELRELVAFAESQGLVTR